MSALSSTTRMRIGSAGELARTIVATELAVPEGVQARRLRRVPDHRGPEGPLAGEFSHHPLALVSKRRHSAFAGGAAKSPRPDFVVEAVRHFVEFLRQAVPERS